MANLLLPPELQFVNHVGAPLAGGRIFTYVPGTSTDKATWQDAAETISWTNPIVLDDRGAAQVYGDGDYRLILEDADGNQIFDTSTTEPLAANVISSVMLPVVGAQSLQQARDLMGVTAAIQAALTAINLISGPTGPTGPAGIQGPVGTAGPTGASAANTEYHGGNPAWWRDNTTGFLVQFGFGSTDGTGNAVVGFRMPFTTEVVSVLATSDMAWANVSGITGTNFNVQTASPIFGGRWNGGPLGFWWVAFGK